MALASTKEDLCRLEKSLTAAVDASDMRQVSDCLDALTNLKVNLDMLQASTCARSVGKLRKHEDPEIASRASKLVASWKAIVASAPPPVTSSKSGQSSSNPSTATTRLTFNAEQQQPLLSVKKHNLASAMATDVNTGASAKVPSWHYLPETAAATSMAARVRAVGASQPTKRTVTAVGTGPVVYWMSRDQRLNDNWALLHAQNLAVANNAPLVIVFNLVPAFAGATARSYGFMLRALKVLAARAAEEFNIEFQLLLGEPQTTVVEFVASRQASALICDYSPTRVAKKWRAAVADGVHALPSDAAIPVLEVDAHNISPVWHTSNKCEFGARTIRPKVHKAMGSFLVEFPPLKRHPHGSAQALTSAHWTSALDSLTGMDSSVPEVDWCVPGEDAAAVALDAFMGGGGAFARLAKFGDDRNDPTKRSGSSNLSPYLHFGHLSAQRVALEVMRLEARGRSRGVVLESLFPDERTTGPHSFLEELVVRRELSDNFVEYNAHYDSIEGAHAWAQATIEEHRSDPRPILYTRDQLERAATKDDLWNAAQREMVSRGKMHGFLRMYWAKKILEWSPSTEEALASALYLNDKYELDGRDPNGYVGCLWAIAGVHDRAWGPERPIFGKIRYMNYDGCKRKFSIPSYVAANPRLSMNSAKSSSSSASSPKPAFGASK